MIDLAKMKVTKRRIELFNKLGIFNDLDLVRHLPSRFDDFNLTELKHNEKVVVLAKVIGVPKISYFNKMSKMIFSVITSDNEIQVIIYNRHFYKNQISLGKDILIRGKYDELKKQLVASDLIFNLSNNFNKIIPIYPTVEGLKQNEIRQEIAKALKNIKVFDILPIKLREKYRLLSYQKALELIHFPQTENDYKQALRLLKYQEFFSYQLHKALIKKEFFGGLKISKKFIDEEKIKELEHILPFDLTSEQKKVINEIIADFKSDKIMFRLLQGDVGSGKTIVAFFALFINCIENYQGALLAPTEILAVQHYQNLLNIFKDYNFKICLLTGSTKPKEKLEILKMLKAKEIDILVGTHALYSDDVIYNDLKLVVIDEQHRFGVEQRKKIKAKGEEVDLLLLSATPIPRTLALCLYGDMDVSTIENTFNPHKTIETKLIKKNKLFTVLNEVEPLLKTNQMYVVCSTIEENESLNLQNATNIYQGMKTYFEPDFKVGLLHGKMSNDEKEKVMADFKCRNIDILVSTTVIEVGIDVASANIIVIYDADRFGLSQLHQLRGRVGRGKEKGYCYLLTKSSDELALKRLEMLCETTNGFEISEYDLKLRGPGDLLGLKQSGLPTFRVASLVEDHKILEIAKRDVQEIIDDPNYQDYINNFKLSQIDDSLKYLV